MKKLTLKLSQKKTIIRENRKKIFVNFIYFSLNILTVNMQNINFPDDLIRTAKLVVRMRPLGHNHCPRLNSISLNSDFY